MKMLWREVDTEIPAAGPAWTVESPPDFELDREVRLVDTDATGLCHFGAYVRMMEETEYGFLRSRGLSVVLRDERGTLGFPRLSVSLDIARPLTGGEHVGVQMRLVQRDGKRIDYQFRILDSEREPVADGAFRVACCRFPDNQPPFAILIPDFVDAALQRPLDPVDDPGTASEILTR